MISLFVYNNFHAGDLLFNRPLYRLLAADGRFRIAIGCHRNTAYLYEDLVGETVSLQVSHYVEKGPTVLFDLGAETPNDHLPIDTWLGTYPDTGNHQWRNVLEVCRRQLAARGIEWHADDSAVPMIDFTPRSLTPRLTRPTVYVDNSPCRSGQSTFAFDLHALSRALPDHQFLCTRRPRELDANIIDGSHLDLRDLSAVSEQCVAILGKGSGPFCCTYTEANRQRPRAVCGYRSDTSPTFWDYPDNPLRYLHTMTEVIEFITRAAAANAGRQEVSC